VDVRDATETLRHAGWYGVLLFNFMFTMGQLMRMPGFIFLIIGGITYGRVYGFVVNILALPVVLGVQFVIYRKCARPLSLAAFLCPSIVACGGHSSVCLHETRPSPLRRSGSISHVARQRASTGVENPPIHCPKPEWTEPL
jgi:hypothetical protein